ncbi:hypothetical protein DERP_010784 [Dermatophagoides pteronyssinus]|uniref:Uncharacterized protein n=1 Tax=Dermatophagoides pteronyssinus TaxID=6956 RepID=A0ABQ8J758_DERPT|nr:hypothetical protein DERP_010784 [Dermatophagoides pteronyssinus]
MESRDSNQTIFLLVSYHRRPRILTIAGVAVVERNNSIYLEPINSRCFCNERIAISSVSNKTNASPVGRPSGFLTNNTPSSPCITLH